MSETTAPRTPWHLWVVGGLALLWNAVGAFDYLMTQTQNEAYMSNFTPEQLEFFYGFPTWVVAAWAISVWGSVLGAILLLLRRKLAAPVFLTVVVTMLITMFHNFVLSNGLELMGDPFSLVFTVVVVIVAVLLVVYARKQTRAGVLR